MQIKAVAASTVSEALSSRQGVYLVRHLSGRRPREPFAAAHSLILSTHADGEHAYMVQRRGEAGPAGVRDGPAEVAQARLAAQYMPRFWHMHAISCGIRLTRELLAAVAGGYVGIVTAGGGSPSGERVSRTLQLRVPLLPSSAPTSPTVRVGGLQHSAGRPRPGAHGEGRGSGGAEDRAESMGLWDLSPAASMPASPVANAGSERGLRPAWSVAAHAHTSQPGSGTRRSDSGSPQAHASDAQEQQAAPQPSAPAEDEPRTTPASDTGVGAAPSTSGGLAEATTPAAAPVPGGDTQAGPAAVAPAAVPPREASVAAGAQDSTGAAALARTAGPEGDRSLTLAPLPAMLMQGGRMPEGIWGEVTKAAGAADAPGVTPVDVVPGSPSLDHMPSFSRWVSMSLSCSVSFGGPVRAEQEVRSRRIAAPVAAEQDAAVERTESECSPPPQGQGRGDAGSSHGQISLAPPPPLPLLQSSRSSQPGRGVEVPSLDLGAGVCGSSSWLPEAPAFGARGTDVWAQTSDVLHVPALLMAALCDVATGGRPGAPPAAAAATMPPPADSSVPKAESASPQEAAAAALPSNAKEGTAAATAQPAAAEGSRDIQAATKHEDTNGAVSGSGEVVADAPPPAEGTAAVDCEPTQAAQDSRALHGLVMTMDQEVIRGAHEALAVALRVPELTPQVRCWPLPYPPTVVCVATFSSAPRGPCKLARAAGGSRSGVGSLPLYLAPPDSPAVQAGSVATWRGELACHACHVNADVGSPPGMLSCGVLIVGRGWIEKQPHMQQWVQLQWPALCDANGRQRHVHVC